MSSNTFTFPRIQLTQEIVRRIVDTVHPERIVLFGSAARDELKPTSDMDLLVVVASGTHRRQTAQKIYAALISVEFPVDVVVVTSEDIQ